LFEENHLLEDFLAALALARALEVEMATLQKMAKKLKSPELRFEKMVKNEILFVKDCYNASEASMEAALENLPMVAGRKIAVLGEMKELGAFSKKCHKKIGKKAFRYADLLLCLGREGRLMAEAFQEEKEKTEKSGQQVFKQAFWFEDQKELALFLKSRMQKGDLVLVKGSRSMAMEKIFDWL
jgi:UDP-N-acetylmuramyl pentapeptide synthase